MGWTAFNRGNGNNKTSGNTMTMVPNATLGAHSIIVLRIGCDNAEVNGLSPMSATSSVTDTKGNTWTRYVGQNRTPGAVALDGVSGAIWCTTQDGGILTTSDTITITFNTGISVPAKVWFLTEFVSDVDAAPIYSAADGNAAGGATNTFTLTTASVPANGLVACLGACGQTAFGADDTDTLNGSWSAGVGDATSGGGGASNVAGRTQHKAVTGAGAQTYNTTLVNSPAWVGLAVILTATGPVTDLPIYPYAVTTFV